MAAAKLTQKQRATTIAAMHASGITQTDIAKQLNISRATVVRDLSELKPSVDEAQRLISEYNKHFDKLYPIAESAAEYVEQAKSDANGAVRMQARIRIDDLRGIRTQKDLDRAKIGAGSEPQPMFILPPGCNLALTINQQNNTISSHDTPTCSELRSLHNTPTETFSSDTTIGRSSQSDADITDSE